MRHCLGGRADSNIDAAQPVMKMTKKIDSCTKLRNNDDDASKVMPVKTRFAFGTIFKSVDQN